MIDRYTIFETFFLTLICFFTKTENMYPQYFYIYSTINLSTLRVKAYSSNGFEVDGRIFFYLQPTNNHQPQ